MYEWLVDCFNNNRLKLWTMGCPNLDTFERVLIPCSDVSDILLKKEIEKQILSKDAMLATAYARNILEDRFLLAEPLIATNARASYWYVTGVIGKRWPPCEDALRDTPYEFWYGQLFVD